MRSMHFLLDGAALVERKEGRSGFQRDTALYTPLRS